MSTLNFKSSTQYARQALVDFQNCMVAKFDDDYKLTIPELERKLAEKNPNIMQELGNSVYMSKLGMRRIYESMERVVDKIKVPTYIPDIIDFSNGFKEELSSFDFSLVKDAALEIVEEASEKLPEAVKSLGEGAKKFSLGFLDWAKWVVPVLLIGAFFIWSKTVKASSPS